MSSNPSFHPPELERAIALHRQGDIGAALPIYTHLSQTRPELAEPWHLLGVIELQKGAPDKAEPLLRAALERDGTHMKCLSNLGAALYQLDRLEEAERALRQALELDPDYVEARYNLGNVLTKAERDEDAMTAFDHVLKLQPNHAKALINAGVLHAQHNLHDQAMAYLLQARALAPDDFSCLVNLALSAERLNQMELAKDAVASALAQQPDHPTANLIAAQIDYREKRFDDALAKLAAVASQPNPSITAKLHIEALHTIGLVHDAMAEHDAGHADLAFTSFAAANALDREDTVAAGVDPRRYVARINDASDRLARFTPTAAVTDATHTPPVFFVGFPRSGTTLLEQMLAAHEGVLTTNEISPLERISGDILAAPDLDAVDWSALRARFWAVAEDTAGSLNGRMLVDKMPLNIEYLDLAARLFPDAKLLMALRDPRDVCLSCFMQHFERTFAMTNFQTLDDTARLYDKVMGLWLQQRDALGLGWLEYRYEDLVEDMDATLKPVLDFLGLDWSDAIRNYRNQAQSGRVITPSYAQVGEKLYSRASGRWTKYANHLHGIHPTLAPYIDAFRYEG